MKIAQVSVFVDDPVKAHAYYTEVLGFVSKTFDPDGQLAIIASPEATDGTTILLEPRGDTYAKEYQEKVYADGLPIIVFSVKDVKVKIEGLKANGVKFREDLAKPEWGIHHLFEDTCGNLIMLDEEASPK